MALFSKQNKEAFIKPLNGDNPVLVQVASIRYAVKSRVWRCTNW